MRKYILIAIISIFACGCTKFYSSNKKPHYYKIEYIDFYDGKNALEKQHQVFSYYFDMYINGKNCEDKYPNLKNDLIYTPSCLPNANLVNREVMSIYKGDQFAVHEISKEVFDAESAREQK